jgi:hypothetical protein
MCKNNVFDTEVKKTDVKKVIAQKRIIHFDTMTQQLFF